MESLLSYGLAPNTVILPVKLSLIEMASISWSADSISGNPFSAAVSISILNMRILLESNLSSSSGCCSAMYWYKNLVLPYISKSGTSLYCFTKSLASAIEPNLCGSTHSPYSVFHLEYFFVGKKSVGLKGTRTLYLSPLLYPLTRRRFPACSTLV